MRLPLRTAALGASALMIALSCLLLLAVRPTGSAAAAPHADRVGAAPELPRAAHLLGRLSAGTTLSVDVSLNPRDAAALRAYAEAVSTAAHRRYRHYITVGQFRARFAPTAAQIASVRAGLQNDGLDPGTVSANGLLIQVTASAARLSAAFHTGFNRYRLASGRIAYANTSAPQFSAGLASLVQGVVGLDNLSIPHALDTQRAPSARRRQGRRKAEQTGADPAITACSQALETSTPAVGQGPYRPDEIASAYGLDSLYDEGDEGAGQTVALMEFAPFSLSDIGTYNSCYDIDGGQTSDVSTVAVRAGHQTGAGTGDNEEDVLDIEQVLGLAPAADVAVYEAPDTNAGDVDAYTDMVENQAVDVISTSWGGCEPLTGSAAQAENTVFEEAATEGISVYAAAGDEGSTDCYDANASQDGNTASIPYKSDLEVDDPGSQPWVTSVGGTSLPSDTQPQEQTAWNDSHIGAGNGAGGGGISTLWSMPTYQSAAPTGLGVRNADSAAAPCATADGHSGADCREVPDVSADADPQTGYDIYFSDGAGTPGVDNPGDWQAVGGTSAAAPLWAAMTALADASSSCDGSTVGFANSVLYAIADNATQYANDFTDVTSGDNAYSPSGYSGSLYPATADYDMATGLGAPDAATLVPAMCTEAATLHTGSSTRTTTTTTPTTTQSTPTQSSPTQTPPPAATSPPTTISSPAPTTSTTPSTTGTTAENGACKLTTVRSAADTLALTRHRKSTKLSVALILPSGCGSYTLSLQRHVATTERTGAKALDTLKIELLNRNGRLLGTLATLSNRSAARGYQTLKLNLAHYAGQQLRLSFVAVRRGAKTTAFTLRSVALNLS